MISIVTPDIDVAELGNMIIFAKRIIVVKQTSKPKQKVIIITRGFNVIRLKLDLRSRGENLRGLLINLIQRDLTFFLISQEYSPSP